MTEPEEEFYDDEPGIGCWNCEDGWKHGCMDDMCRSCYPADECDDGYPCRHCNPKGELL